MTHGRALVRLRGQAFRGRPEQDLRHRPDDASNSDGAGVADVGGRGGHRFRPGRRSRRRRTVVPAALRAVERPAPVRRPARRAEFASRSPPEPGHLSE
ncbi:hypothetical protein HBB16_15310 [Pseudonocardia sp. MCCB 268]|nr:hypothetical protein [Pseudonocardia cytotoxica]